MTAPFMIACHDCGGERGYEVAYAATSKWGDPTPGGEWIDCPTCHGSGWLDNHEPAPEIEQDDPRPEEDCPTCKGTGYCTGSPCVTGECTDCLGTGKVGGGSERTGS